MTWDTEKEQKTKTQCTIYRDNSRLKKCSSETSGWNHETSKCLRSSYLLRVYKES